MSHSTAVEKIKFHEDEVLTVLGADGKPHIVLRPALESIGLDYPTQYTKLQGRSWATVGQSPMVAADGKMREMVTVDVRTFLMLLATVDESRVADRVRPKLIAYQSEVADVIEAHWHRASVVSAPTTLLEALETAVAAERARVDAEARAIEATARVVEMAPKVAVHDALMETPNTWFTLAETAQMLRVDGKGRATMLNALRDLGIFCKVVDGEGPRPRQEYCTPEHFLLRLIERPMQPGFMDSVTFVSPRGIAWLWHELQRGGYSVASDTLARLKGLL